MEVTLCILREGDKILLALKKRGFGEGLFNGVGGKVESGETPERAMIRETQEEIGVAPTEFQKFGDIDYDEYYKGERKLVKLHLYLATAWNGELEESDEMIPHWFKISEIPYDRLFPDDKYWLPRVLAGEKVKMFFRFDENWKLLEYTDLS